MGVCGGDGHRWGRGRLYQNMNIATENSYRLKSVKTGRMERQALSK